MQDVEFRVGNTSIRGLAFGDPSKPLILALHGWLDNAASFVPISDYLKDYHLVAIDLPGHGLSDHRSADAHYHLMDYVYDLHALIASQSWNDFILLGHSMGGIIASIYCGTFPDRVNRFITVESFGPMCKDPESSPEQLREAIESRLKLRASVGKQPTSLEATVKARQKAGDLNYDSAALIVQRNITTSDSGLNFRTDRRLRTASSLRLTPAQAEAFMRAISCPMLVINGSDGFDMMKEKLAQRETWIKNLTRAEAKGGHHVHMDNPKSVAQEMLQFLVVNPA